MIDISDLLDFSTLKGTDPIYSWNNPDNNLTYHFAVSRMVEAAKRLNLPVDECFISREHYEFVKANRGVQEEKLAALRKVRFYEPILMARWTDGSHLTLDGNHRTVAAYERGQRTIKYQVMEPYLWSQFILAIIPAGKIPG